MSVTAKRPIRPTEEAYSDFAFKNGEIYSWCAQTWSNRASEVGLDIRACIEWAPENLLPEPEEIDDIVEEIVEEVVIEVEEEPLIDAETGFPSDVKFSDQFFVDSINNGAYNMLASAMTLLSLTSFNL